MWRGSHGDATGEPGVRPVDLQYRIGSITKTMTAVLVMQLRDEGLLDLNGAGRRRTSPRSTCPGVTVAAPAVAQQSGSAPSRPGSGGSGPPGGSFAELVAGLASARDASFAPGRTHHYSNLGYGLLGEVVARLRGGPWWECLSSGCWSRSGCCAPPTTRSSRTPRATASTRGRGTLSPEPATDTGAMAPAGQVWSTVLDLATYADFLIAGHRDVLSLTHRSRR